MRLGDGLGSHRLPPGRIRGPRTEVLARFVNRKSGARPPRTPAIFWWRRTASTPASGPVFPRRRPPVAPRGRCSGATTTEAAPFLTGRSMIMAGHAAQKFVAYPICPVAAAQGRSLINWIAELGVGTNLPDRRDWNRRGSKADFASAFAAWRFDWLDVPALIDRRGARSSSFRWSIATRWTAGVSAALRFWVTPLTRCTLLAPTALPRPFSTPRRWRLPWRRTPEIPCRLAALRIQTVAAHGQLSCAAIGKWDRKSSCKWWKSGRRAGSNNSGT